jgi:hypothetical protein
MMLLTAMIAIMTMMTMMTMEILISLNQRKGKGIPEILEEITVTL